MALGMAALVALAVGSIVVGEKRADKVEAAQEEQAATERAIQGEKSARAKRQTLAKAQVSRAEIENVAAVGGQNLGSAAITGTQNVTAQATENISQINQSIGFANRQSEAAQNVNKAGRSSIGEQIIHQGAGVASGVLGTQLGKKLA